MEEESDVNNFAQLVKKLFREIINVLKKRKLKGIIVLALIILQIFSILFLIQRISRLENRDKILTTRMKTVSPSDLPVFTFCSKEQYR